MEKVFVNPFAIVQRDGSESYIVLTSSPDNIVKIFNPDHPLYGIKNIENMVSRISLLQDADIDFLAHGANSVKLKARVPYLCVFENCLHTFRPMSRFFMRQKHYLLQAF